MDVMFCVVIMGGSSCACFGWATTHCTHIYKIFESVGQKTKPTKYVRCMMVGLCVRFVARDRR